MTDDRVPESRTGTYPWRYRCPEGHATIQMNAETFTCRSCSETYPKSELVDLAPEGGQHSVNGP